MSALSDFFGGEEGVQQFFVWAVAQSVVGAILAPVLTEIQQEAWKTATAGTFGLVGQTLTPAQLADMVVRNFIDDSDASIAAGASGITEGDFALMVDDAGEPPGPDGLARAVLKGIITATGTGADSTSFQQGIAEGRIKDKWGPIIQSMAQEWPSTADAIQAYVRGQLTQADAQTLYEQVGGNPDYFNLLYDTRGNPPTPTQLITLVRRGLIPQDGLGADVLSLQQGIAEGDTKDKWYPMYQQLSQYLPPARTVTALQRAGVITDAQATQLYTDLGLSTELAQAYLLNASVDKVAGTKLLAEGTVLTLYEGGGIDQATAMAYLGDLGYSSDEATFVLATYDFKREVTNLNKAIERIGTLYTTHKVTRQAAVTALGDLDVPDAQQTALFFSWDITAENSPAVLTARDIQLAFFYTAISQAQAMTALGNLGYTPFDAWILLVDIGGVILPDQPPQGAQGPGVNP